MDRQDAQLFLRSEFPIRGGYDRGMEIYLRLLSEGASDAIKENDVARLASIAHRAKVKVEQC